MDTSGQEAPRPSLAELREEAESEGISLAQLLVERGIAKPVDVSTMSEREKNLMTISRYFVIGDVVIESMPDDEIADMADYLEYRTSQPE